MFKTWLFVLVVCLIAFEIRASVCEDVFKENKSQFLLSYERRCLNSSYKNAWQDKASQGEVNILSTKKQKIGSYYLTCTTTENSNLDKAEINLQLSSALSSGFSGRTMVLGGKNDSKQIYFFDCNNVAVFLINIGVNQVMIDNQLVETYVSVYPPLGSYPTSYITKLDYDNGQLILRGIDGKAQVALIPQTAKQGDCEYAQWQIEILNNESDMGLAFDPRVISLIMSYLILAKDPYESCFEMSWTTFGMSMSIFPALLATAYVFYLGYRWIRPLSLRGNYQYINLNDDVP